MPYVKNNGVNIHYEIEGEGSPLVLQHGPTGSLDAWKQLGYTDALRDRYRLYWWMLEVTEPATNPMNLKLIHLI